MKKIRLFIISSIIILLGGCLVNTNSDNYDEGTIKKAKETIDSYIRNNYQNIKTVKFEDGDYSSPMGGLMIEGTVNGKAGFSADIDDNTFQVGSFGEKKGFPELKEECKEKICDNY